LRAAQRRREPLTDATLPDGQSAHVDHAQIARRANLSRLA
jgi:hypothetical protein